MNLFKSASFNLIERSLDATALRQKVTANNIANADTPNFKRSEVKFEQLLQNEMNSSRINGFRTNHRHFEIGLPGSSKVAAQIHTDESSILNNNKNNVDIDAEMSQLAKNQLNYNTLIQQISHQLKQTRTAIGGR
jgi:flagellar basal-body rod protein FlgB